MNRALWVGVPLVAAGLVGALLADGTGRGEQAPVGAPQPVRVEAGAAVASTVAALTTRVRLSMEPPAVLAFGRRPAPDFARLQSALEEAGGDPTESGLRAERHLLRHPEDAVVLLELLADEHDPQRMFRLGLALARSFDDASLRRRYLKLLDALQPAQRVAGLSALVGRTEPEVTAWLLAALEGEERVAGRAGEVLGFAMQDLDPDRAAEARGWARRVLDDPQGGTEGVVGAAAVLGQPELTRADARLLGDALLQATDAATVHALAGALAAGGTSPAELDQALARLEGRASPGSGAAARLLRERLQQALAGQPPAPRRR